jgi:hypothetical protein
MATPQRYPLATVDGISIPLDAIRPIGYCRIDFNNSGGTSQLTIPTGCELIAMVADMDCVITFGKVASLPADSTILTDAIFLVRGQMVIVSPNATTVSVHGAGTIGTLICNFLDKWAGLALQTMLDRR